MYTVVMGDPVVNLDNGLARGVVEKHEDGFDYYAFKGIPYAEPPIGELRFQDPVPIKNWTGVVDCKKYGGKCTQHDILMKSWYHNEDCLYLNVYTNSINEKRKSNAVIVIIHGGFFLCGSGCDQYLGPEHLIRKNVVVVTMNYRLGILGFLNLEDEVAPGNQGLKDQLLVIQWVQRNIRIFNGDPDNVTLLGIDAGGICAHYLSLSPLAQGLFHKVILQAGMIQNDWGFVDSPKRIARKLCMLLGKELVDPREIVQFLRTVDIVKLFDAQIRLRKAMMNLPFTPGCDGHSTNPILANPEIECKRGVQLPCIVGFNGHEAAIFLLGMTIHEFFETCDKDIGTMLKYNSDVALTRCNLTKAQLRRLYYNSEKISEKNVDIFIDLASDIYFVEAICRFINVQAAQSSAATYVYKFSYGPENSFNSRITNYKPKGPGCYDEIPYLFKMRTFEKLGLNYFEKGTKDYEIMERMTEMWTNFAKYGKPTVETSDLIPVHWKPVGDSPVIRYLAIDEDIRMDSTLNFGHKFPTVNQ